MKRNETTREELLAHCQNLHADDGRDPREWYAADRLSRRTGRKTQQLCRQVQRTLELALGETGDELLGSLHVESVTPAPNAAQLLVTLSADMPRDEFDRTQIDARLARHAGRLRCEVAAAITRKKAPRLLFHILPPPA